jgi:HEAT repeat protein
MSTNSAPLEGRPLSAWVEDVDVDYLDTPEAKHARDVLKQGGPAIIPDIIAILNDPTAKARLRGNAAQALGWAGTKDGPEVEALWNALGDEQRYVRYSASYSLRRLRVDARRLVPKLMEMLDDPDSYVRRGVADNLGVIGKPARVAIPNLQKLLNDDEQKTRDKAAQAIKRLEATSPPTAGTPTTQ